MDSDTCRLDIISEIGRYKIAICPGHYPDSPGAKSHWHFRGIDYIMNEHTEALKVIEYLYYNLRDKSFMTVEIFNGTLEKKVEGINKYHPHLALEVHFNSHADSDAHGCEVLHSGTAKSIDIAERIQRRLVEILKREDRGTKVGYYEGNTEKGMLYYLKKTKCPAIIIEPLFLSNLNDAGLLFSLQGHIKIESAIRLGINDYIITKHRRYEEYTRKLSHDKS